MKNITIIILAALLTGLVGCAGNRTLTSIKESSEAKEIFFNDKVAPGYDYYYYGTGEKPIALLALDKTYSLDSVFWHKIRLSDWQLQEWSARFRDNSFRPGLEYRAKAIVSQSSQTIGYVISRNHFITAWFEDDDTTIITIPPPELLPMQPDPLDWRKNDR